MRGDSAAVPAATERTERLASAGVAVLLMAAGTALCLHHGRLGLAANDQSIVFDAGWRVLRGQVPYREFLAPAGAPVFLMQAAVFWLFGVSWLSFALHAAVLNGLFAVLVFVLLRTVGGSVAASGLYGLLAAVAFYPPFGLPHVEQHSFLFSLVSVLLAERGTRAGSERRVAAWWAASSLALVVAALCKPIPALFVTAALAVLFLGSGSVRRRGAALGAASGLAATALGLVALGTAVGYDPSRVASCLVGLPSETGAPRLERLFGLLEDFGPGAVLLPALGGVAPAGASLAAVATVALAAGATLLRLLSRWSWAYASFLLVPALALAALLPGRPRRVEASRRLLALAGTAVAAAALLLPTATDVFAPLALAGAAALAGFALLAARVPSPALRAALCTALAAGAAVAYFRGWSAPLAAVVCVLGVGVALAPALPAPPPDAARRSDSFRRTGTATALLSAGLLFSLLSNTEPENGAAFVFVALGLCHVEVEVRRREGEGDRSTPAAGLLLALLATVGTVDAVRFERDVNVARRLLFRAEPRPVAWPPGAPEALAFLRVDAGSPATPSDLSALCRFLGERRGAFLLLGTHTFLHGVTGRTPVDPALWYHPGLSLPRPGSAAFPAYVEEFRRNAVAAKVEWVVLERGWGHLERRLQELPWLRAAIERPRGEVRRFGTFEVVPVDPAAFGTVGADGRRPPAVRRPG